MLSSQQSRIARTTAPSPGGVPGATLWFVPTQYNGQTWTDQSGSGLVSAEPAAASGFSSPTKLALDANYNPGVGFNGSNQELRGTLSSNAYFGGANSYMFAISEASSYNPSVATFGDLLSGYGGPGQGIIYYNYTYGDDLGYNHGQASFSVPTPTSVLSDVDYASQGNGENVVIGLNGIDTTSSLGNPVIASSMFEIGARTTPNLNNRVFNGSIDEVLFYGNLASPLTATQITQIRSYLALKYGITLGFNTQAETITPTDYLSSGGITFWSGAENPGYGFDVAGIGRDTTSGLSQRVSHSSNPSNYGNAVDVSIANGPTINTTAQTSNRAFSADQTFVMWGDNGGSATVSTMSGVNRMARVWRTQVTGTGSTELTLQVPASALSGVTNPSLLVSDDPTFQTTIKSLALKCGSTYCDVTFPTFTSTSTQYFTFGSKAVTFNAYTIATDPFDNSNWEDQTAVGPVIGTNGSLSLSVFLLGRFYGDAAAAMGYATSNDAVSWTTGVLPNLTTASSSTNPYDRITFPSIAWNQRFSRFLISLLPISNTPSNGDPDTTLPPIVETTSDGVNFTNPVITSPGGTRPEKNFVACDNSSSSPYYGNCYVTWDDDEAQPGLLFHANVSTDGGQTWGATETAADSHTAYGAIPVILPNGTVVVTSEDGNGYDGPGSANNIISSVSTDGGTTWSSAYEISPITTHTVAGSMRTQALPTTAIDASGNIYTVWQDCRFRSGCSSNDLVMSESTDGQSWSTPTRIDLDPATSTVDHFLPTIAIRNAKAGSTIGLSYYEFPQANCTVSSCRLSAKFSNSGNGGTTWSTPSLIYGPMDVTWLASTESGYMVGDYFTATYPQAYFGPIAIATAPSTFAYDEAIGFIPGGNRSGTGPGSTQAAAGLGAADNAAMHLGGVTPTYRHRMLAPHNHVRERFHRGL